jgi:hypothetical protein
LFSSTFPALVANVPAATSLQGGVGGTVRREQRVLPSFDVDFGGTRLTLKDLPISDEASAESSDHGRLGQDALRARGGYVLDFSLMRFELGGGQ